MKYFKLICLIVLFSLQTTVLNAKQLNLIDVSKRYSYRYHRILSAFPQIYNQTPSLCNEEIICALHFHAIPKDSRIVPNDDFYQRRIEVYLTIEDGMRHPVIYFITDAEQKAKRPDGSEYTRYSDRPRAYFIKDFSTDDFIDGLVPPQIDIVAPNGCDWLKTKTYILEGFLDNNGMVKPDFLPVCQPEWGRWFQDPCVIDPLS